MLRSLILGLTLVVLGQAVESSNPKKSKAKSHVAVDAHGEVHHVTARAQHPVEEKAEAQEPRSMTKGFNVRSSVVSPKISKSTMVKEHKIEAPKEQKIEAPIDKTVRVDAAAPTEDSAPKQDAPPAETQTAAPETAPSPAPEQKSIPDKSTDAPAPAVSAEPESGNGPAVALQVFIVATLLFAAFLIGFIMRERIMEALPSAVQDAVCSARQQMGFEATLRESRPSGPRKKMQCERSESSQAYSSMRQAAYADQSEYLSPAQTDNDTSSTSEDNGEVPTARA
eukprot:gnl/MRDRNA2_/MRDRNA2_100829_c0_seq1.p1 gnl/MRDRNA2_/MRDRNA2_100829_c0~~gnl/MRDRNA2_/MRDRNA2_100829_c0_seq1.p1  ORF type:complete len:282 (-),score=64.93 gnl/MRDRNA2_/MRDRNA2_100829_c0_seq1:16-861(-)